MGLESSLSYYVYPWLMTLILCPGFRIFWGVECVCGFAVLCDGLGSLLLCVPFYLVFLFWYWYVGGGFCCCGLMWSSCCCLSPFWLRFPPCFWPCGQVIRCHCPFAFWCVSVCVGGIWVFCSGLRFSPFWSLRWCLRVPLLVAPLSSWLVWALLQVLLIQRRVQLT